MTVDSSTEIVLTIGMEEFPLMLKTGDDLSVKHQETVMWNASACVWILKNFKTVYPSPMFLQGSRLLMMLKYVVICDKYILQNSESPILIDFNFPHIDWMSISGTKGGSHKMPKVLQNNYVRQMVTEPMQQSNTLDLVVVTQDNLVGNVTSEHLILASVMIEYFV